MEVDIWMKVMLIAIAICVIFIIIDTVEDSGKYSAIIEIHDKDSNKLIESIVVLNILETEIYTKDGELYVIPDNAMFAPSKSYTNAYYKIVDCPEHIKAMHNFEER